VINHFLESEAHHHPHSREKHHDDNFLSPRLNAPPSWAAPHPSFPPSTMAAKSIKALACHPLDTIKVRMQLSTRRGGKGGRKGSGFYQTGKDIVKRETFLGLYKGLGAVLSGIVPKMAIRFTSYEKYKQLLANEQGYVTSQATFLGE
jgi:hypothetical protein